MNFKVYKVLAVISIIIFIIGVLCVLGISNSLGQSISETNQMYVDGSDFTPFVKAFGTLGTMAISIIIMFYDITLILAIWGIYGISLLIYKIITKIKKRSNNKGEKL